MRVKKQMCYLLTEFALRGRSGATIKEGGAMRGGRPPGARPQAAPFRARRGPWGPLFFHVPPQAQQAEGKIDLGLVGKVRQIKARDLTDFRVAVF